LVRQQDGKQLVFLSITDSTERRRAQDLQTRTQKMEALGTLAGGIAHDLNNVMSAINGNARLGLQDLPADHPIRPSLEQIAKAGERATDLVRRIVTFSRPIEPRQTSLQLQPTIEEALKLLRPTLPSMIEIRCQFPSDLPPVVADTGQIHQLLMNL